MEQLYSPWRGKYITTYKRPETCFFCEGLAQGVNSAENLIVHRGGLAFVMLNRFPYTSGHLLIAPHAHVATLSQLDGSSRAEIMELVNHGVHVLEALYHPQGFNIGSNIGMAAGAGVPDHVHFHVLPRWNGDTNFTTTVGQTRVLPETLEDTWQKVSQAWRQIAYTA